MISKDKKYKTRCGYKATILSIEENRVVFACKTSSEWGIYTADLNGNFFNDIDAESKFDLIEVTEKTFWIEVYVRDGIAAIFVHKSKEDAERSIANDKEKVHLDLIERTYEL